LKAVGVTAGATAAVNAAKAGKQMVGDATAGFTNTQGGKRHAGTYPVGFLQTVN